MTEPLAPIVLVHGAWHGAWCWDRFADRLRDAGHAVTAVTLPGHDRPGDHRRIWSTAASYVATVGAAVDAQAAPPVLVGHSMGGYVVQRHLEEGSAAGAVLLASLPRWGVLPATATLLRTRTGPALRSLATTSLWPVVGAPGAARELFFGPDADPALVADTAGQLQNESYPAFVAMTARLVRLRRITTPTLVLAAELDAMFPVAAQARLAAALDAPLEVVVGSGHDLMLDAGWEGVADRVDGFAQSLR